MKVRLFDEPEPVKEKEMILRLYKKTNSTGLNEIVIGIVDESGSPVFCGQLLAFDSNMRLKRRCAVNATYGLPLDNTGRLKGEGE